MPYFLLHSQPYLWDSPFLGRFLHMWLFFFFFNESTAVVTFCLRGWCRLGAFLLPAFTRLGHECQNLWIHVMECVRAQTRPWFILLSKRVSGNRVRTHVDSKGKIPSIGRLRRGSNPRCCNMQNNNPSHNRLSYPGPLNTLPLVQSPWRCFMQD